MGLDMYAFTVPAGADLKDENVKSTDLAYWRKFNALHGWMEDLYYAKGGDAESFNCIPLRLTLEDLNRLEKDISGNNLKPRTGFFFGSQDIWPEDVDATTKFIAEAREAILDGRDVYYDSWW